MITWMPHIEPGKAAQSLTDEDLVEQVETSTEVLRLLLAPPDSPTNKRFLAISMWGPYQWRLCIHGLMMANELVTNRNHSLPDLDTDLLATTGTDLENGGDELLNPPWLGDLHIHRSHRSQLIRSRREYAPQWPGTPADMPILWPQLVQGAPRGYRLRLSTNDIRLLRRGALKLPEELTYRASANEVVET
jgi:hypothetical protein